MIRTSLLSRRALVLGILALCAFASIASATIINVPADYPTIQLAVNAASTGDTIQVAAGTYTETVTIATTLTINGAGATTIVTGPTAAAGVAQGGAFIVTGSVTVTISNLTAQNSVAQGGVGGTGGGAGGGGGGAAFGGALFIGTGANVTISSVIFQNNAANGGAGGNASGSASGHCQGGNSSLGSGGGACSTTNDAVGFGGGGGALNAVAGNGGVGAFGGGGGGGSSQGRATAFTGGLGGFGAGGGGDAPGGGTGGGGGGAAGFGGGVFVQQGGSLSVAGTTTITGNTSQDGGPGAGYNGGISGTGATLAFGGIFLQGNDANNGGSGTITFSPNLGETQNDADGISDQTGLAGTGGSWSLVKNGHGLLVINASNNNYSGTTAINAGFVEVVGILGLVTGGDVTVASGAVLGGGGTVQPNVVLSSGAILAPGLAAGIPETLNLQQKVTWNGSPSSPMMAYILYASGSSDKVAIGGPLTKGSAGTFQFNFQNTGAVGTYTLMTFASTTFVVSDFSYANLGPGLTGAFSVGANAIQFTVSQAATSTGVSPSPNPVAAGATETLTATVTSGVGTPTGTVTFVDTTTSTTLATVALNGAGQASFSTTTLSVGPHNITATYNPTAGTWAGSFGTTSVTVNQAATHFSVTASSPQTAGIAFNVTVTALDASNATVTGYAGTVHFTSSDGQAVLPANSGLAGGTGTFAVTLKTAGNQTVTATDTVTTSITGTTSTIVVNAAAANHFVVSAPGTATSGSAFNFTVTAVDQFNNTATTYPGTVHFTSSDGSATLPANSGLSGGAGTFSATLLTSGNQTITATDTVTGSITGTSGTINVHAGTATHLAVTAASPETAGAAFSVTVTALDGGNNAATGYTGTIHFTKSDSGAGSALPANYTFTGPDGGVHTFTATLVTAGSQSITATDTVTGSITGTATITVNAASATHFTVSATSPQTSGAAFNFTVTALDQFNNTATTYGGTVHFTSTDGLATLPANSTLNSGAGTFSATLKTAGNQTITATDTVSGSITGMTPTITVNPGLATHFSVSAASPQTAGTAFNFTVVAQDASNNTATGYTGAVHFTSTDSIATLPANSTLGNGVGTFSATLKTSGSQTITATDTVSGSITGASNGIIVTAGPATHLAVSASGSEVAGVAFNVLVVAQDQFNNTASNYLGTVHFTSSDGQATLPADSPLPGGFATLSATLKTAGGQTITATDTVTNSITGRSNTILVSAAAASHFVVTAPPTVTLSNSFSFIVTAQDAFGNVASGYGGMVHFTSTDPAAVLPANSILTAGVGSFNATLKTFGIRTITATDTVSGSITGTSGNINVNGILTVTANGANRPYGTANSLSYTITGFQGSDTVAVVSGAPALSSTASLSSPPGNYTVTATQGTLSATNYVFTFVPGSMTVVKASTSLGVNGVSPGVTASQGQSFVVSFIVASAVGAAAPTGTVSYSVDGGAVQTATLNNGTVTVTFAGLGAGAHIVSNSYSGDGNYLPTTATPLTLTIMKSSAQLSVVVLNGTVTPQFTLDFTVTGSGSAAPTGTVTCAFPSLATQQATLTGGSGSLPISGLLAGVYPVNCSYGGDANYPAAIAPTVTLTVTPQLNAGGVVSAAGVNSGVSPGWLISLYGINLQGSTSTGGSVTATSLPLPTTLGGAQVLVNGTPAPLLFVSPLQINAQAPFETPAGTPVQVVVVSSGLSSLPVMVTFNTYAPSIFLYPRTATSTDPVITHTDGTLVTPSSPAHAGEIVTIWATGGGPLNNQPADGAPGPTSPLASTVVTPTVTIGGLGGTVLFSGLAPTFVGEMQINVQLPATLPTGIGTPPSLPVVVMFPGANSTPVNLWTNQ